MRTDFRPDLILAELSRHGVGCIVIGGLAACLQGSPLPTEDVDVVPADDPDNLTTTHGALHLSFTPSGTRGYADLRCDAIEVFLRGTPCCASCSPTSCGPAGTTEPRRAVSP